MCIDSEHSAITRFAPSPTGFLHLGHAYSALIAKRQAMQTGGRFLLRIEDIDPNRCKTKYEAAIYEDLNWLGLTWEIPVRRQSEHLNEYAKAINTLQAFGFLYPCFCTRKDIQNTNNRDNSIHLGLNAPSCPGICRVLSSKERKIRISNGDSFAMRLDVNKALAGLSSSLHWNDLIHGKISATPEIFGDVVLVRKDIPTSYHLAVTIDDHLQGVTLVTRGEDLFSSTHIHRLLQELLGLNTPDYYHHPLLTDKKGRRYSKRDKSLSIRKLRDEGKGPEQIRQMVGLS
ncbi:MAG: tRNA glutamyl-Q(34) synthetase GluQRS [Magnetovibrio sp.]|mgnify:CR=1 FL=1|nr:tRNA glutamyl-Q(34) synthetase GluQRS [Magnetovibrio sp.]|tara:strand:- start:1560 stop:2420 length:861 start_codon:yes stop_codon:yes gene_type:complete